MRRFKPSVVHLEERTLLSTNLVVTTLADDPGHLIRGQTTLRDAITLADANSASQYTIKFAVRGTIRLAQALPDLTAGISIVGPGVTIQQTAWFGVNNNTQQPLSVFTVDTGAVVSLSGMTLTVLHGLDPSGVGSSIYNDGLLTVTSTAFTNGCVNDPQGVLIVNNSTCTSITNGGVATISHSTFNGSGISNLNGTMTVIGSTFTHNTSGAIFNDAVATLTIVNSVFADNSYASSCGGAIWNNGISTILDSTFINNSATEGGAIYNNGTMIVQQSAFWYNHADTTYYGGAIFTDGDMSISSNSFAYNSAGYGGGVCYSTGYGNITTVNGCTFVHNAGGNIYSGSLGCFIAGTPVKTEHGLRPIEEIKAGEKVHAYDHKTESWILASVIKPLTHDYSGDFISIGIQTTVGDDRILSTGNHPFWVTSGKNLDGRPDIPLLEQAMTTNGRWVEARDLCVGDTLLQNDNSVATIVDICSSTGHRQVHNFEIEAVHNYAVGSAGVLVHNKPVPQKTNERGELSPDDDRGSGSSVTAPPERSRLNETFSHDLVQLPFWDNLNWMD